MKKAKMIIFVFDVKTMGNPFGGLDLDIYQQMINKDPWYDK